MGQITRKQTSQEKFELTIPLVELLVMIRAAYKAVLPAGGEPLNITGASDGDGEFSGLAVTWSARQDQEREENVEPTLPGRVGCPFCGSDDAHTVHGRCGTCGRRRGRAELGVSPPQATDGDGHQG